MWKGWMVVVVVAEEVLVEGHGLGHECGHEEDGKDGMEEALQGVDVIDDVLLVIGRF